MHDVLLIISFHGHVYAYTNSKIVFLARVLLLRIFCMLVLRFSSACSCNTRPTSPFAYVFILFARVRGRRELFFITMSCCTNVLFLPDTSCPRIHWVPVTCVPYLYIIPRSARPYKMSYVCCVCDKYKAMLLPSCVFSFCHTQCLLHWPCILVLLCHQ